MGLVLFPDGARKALRPTRSNSPQRVWFFGIQLIILVGRFNLHNFSTGILYSIFLNYVIYFQMQNCKEATLRMIVMNVDLYNDS